MTENILKYFVDKVLKEEDLGLEWVEDTLPKPPFSIVIKKNELTDSNIFKLGHILDLYNNNNWDFGGLMEIVLGFVDEWDLDGIKIFVEDPGLTWDDLEYEDPLITTTYTLNDIFVDFN